jgi:hypothetical protein
MVNYNSYFFRLFKGTLNIKRSNIFSGAPDSVVVMAAGYELHGPGLEPWWGRPSRPMHISPEAHPASCTVRTGSVYRD